MAGYSKKSLQSKLGIKEGFRILLVHVPEAYRSTLGPLPDKVVVGKRMTGSFNFIQAFVTDEKVLGKEFPLLKKHLSRTGMLWVSWPKLSSKEQTNLDENVVREIGLRNGLVDVKVCAIDEIWSGLKFVYRVQQRLF